MPHQNQIVTLRAARVVPVVRTSTAALAATAVGWLREAGLRIFEITMTIPDAPALIRDLASDPSLTIGAGTVGDRTTNLRESEDAKRRALGPVARKLSWLWERPVRGATRLAAAEVQRRSRK